MVERYDRIVDDSGAVVRVHQEDLCQALSVHPDRKYEVDGGPGAEQLGRLIRDVAGDRDVARFFDALVYNWLVLATDGHAKNYSLLLSGHQVRLAPLYDVASALPHLDHPRKARLAQKIGGEYRPSFVQRRHWERLARSLGLGSAEAHARITALAERLPDALADAAGESAPHRRRTAHRRHHPRPDLQMGSRACRRARVDRPSGTCHRGGSPCGPLGSGGSRARPVRVSDAFGFTGDHGPQS